MRGKRRDENEVAIVGYLRSLGCSVARLEPVDGAGLPDLLVGKNGATVLVEVKGEVGPQGGTKDRKLNVAQREWWSRWSGDMPVIARTFDDAAAIANVIGTPGWTSYARCNRAKEDI